MRRIFSVHSIFNLGYKISYNSNKYLSNSPDDVVKQLFVNRHKYIDPVKSLSLIIHLRDIKNDEVYRYLIKENAAKKYDHLTIVNLDKKNNDKNENNNKKV